jgi:DNA-directed RNA polymerase I and III subunit RPAC2
MLKMMLLRNPKIRFAAYRKPHPLENKIEIKIQTNGEITANEAFKEALSNLTQDLNQCQRSFLDQLRNFDSNK